MGEAKRRKRESAAKLSEIYTCSYARAPAIYLLDPESTLDLDASDIADTLLAPNAMMPRGVEVFDADAADRLAAAMAGKVRAVGRTCAFDASGEFVRSFEPGDPALAALQPLARGIEVDCQVSEGGERIAFRSNLAGEIWDSEGNPVADPAEAFAGLVRLDFRGRPIVPADAPLSVQTAAIGEAMVGLAYGRHGTEGDGDDPSLEEALRVCLAHRSQIFAVSRLVASGPPLDPGAWIDLQVCFETAMMATRDAIEGDIGDAELALLDAAEEARPTDPRWKLAGLAGSFAPDWVARDEPGSGREWHHLDEAFSKDFPDAPAKPSGSAEWLLPPSSKAASVREFVGSCRSIARKGRSALAVYDAGEVYLYLAEGDGAPLLVAWPMRDTVEGRRDPLMAERLVGFEPDDAELPDPLATPRLEEGFRALLSGDLVDALPQPDLEPEYALDVLAQAHRRGLRIPDLLASLAEAVEAGAADASFRASDIALGGDLTIDFDVPLYEEGDEGGEDGYGDPSAANENVAANNGEAPDDEGLPEYLDGYDETELTGEERAERDAVVAAARSVGGTPDPLLVAMVSGVGDAAWSNIDLDREVRLLRDAYGMGSRLTDLAAARMAKREGFFDGDEGTPRAGQGA